jgi:hypothetical protein
MPSVLLRSGFAAVAAWTAAAPVQAGNVLRLVCAAKGAKMLSPPMADVAACDRFGAALSKAAKVKVRALAALPDLKRDREDWTRVTLRFAKPGIATLILSDMHKGQSIVHPSLSIAVTDRVIGANEIDELARQAATILRVRRR